ANQPVATKCDLNKKTTSLINGSYEFEFNKNLDAYFFDENSLYTKLEPGDYTHYTVGREGLMVTNMWTGINMVQIFSVGEIETKYVINSPLQLPLTKGYLVIEDHFSLPEGFTVEESINGLRLDGGYFMGDYLVKNSEGDTIAICHKAVYVDAKAFGMPGKYKLIKAGNNYTLQTLVPVEWLTKTDNTYPLFIDPTWDVAGVTKLGDFRSGAGQSANLGFTSMSLGACNYHMDVTVPGRSKLVAALVDLEYELTYDNTCGTPPLPPPYCTFSQVSQHVVCDTCHTTTGLLGCNPAAPPYTGTCTTDSNLVPGAHSISVMTTVPNYLACIPMDTSMNSNYVINFTLQNQDSICGDVCGYLCARGNIWQMTIEAQSCHSYIFLDEGDSLLAPDENAAVYRWYRNDTLISGADSSWYVASLPGVYKVFDSNDSCGMDTFLLTQAMLTDLKSIATDNNALTIIPNPSKGNFTARCTSDENFKNATLRFFDNLGRTIITKNISVSSGVNNYEMSENKLAAGIYYIEVDTGKKLIRQKVQIE
ncbi:MAG: T9SS type A sorting domain-containing protein, partial [Legionellales bacterium]